MTSVTRRYTFDAAHRIPGDSICGNLHGHTYTVDVTCQGELDGMGMVVNFRRMDDTIGKWIKGSLDHAVLYANGDRDTVTSGRCWCTIRPPTAEVIAQLILSVARKQLDCDSYRVSMVRVYETARSWADAHSS